jgi:hypothetical protein
MSKSIHFGNPFSPPNSTIKINVTKVQKNETRIIVLKNYKKEKYFHNHQK